MENKVIRDSMVFYDSFYESVVDLPPEEFKKSVCTILGYGLYGETPTTTGIEKTIFILVKPQIDKNNQRWSNAKKSRAAENRENSEVVPSKMMECEQDKICTTVREKAVQEPKEEIPLPEEPPFEEEFEPEPDDYSHVNNLGETASDIRERCGEYNNVLLSVKERNRLVTLLGLDEYMKRLEFFSAYLMRKPHHKSACHYVDLTDWVGVAVNERRLKDAGQNKSKSEHDLEDFFEIP